MKYEECANSIKHGDIVYICDYRFYDIDEKPIRHIKPQKVMVFDNTELPPNKKVYYSKYHFRPLGKKDVPVSKIIAPYDNTGYRDYTGVSLNIFFDKQECIDFYESQCKELIERFKRAKVDKLKYFDSMIDTIEREMETI